MRSLPLPPGAQILLGFPPYFTVRPVGCCSHNVGVAEVILPRVPPLFQSVWGRHSTFSRYTPAGGEGGVLFLWGQKMLCLCDRPVEEISMNGDKSLCSPASNTTSDSLHLCARIGGGYLPKENKYSYVPESRFRLSSNSYLVPRGPSVP